MLDEISIISEKYFEDQILVHHGLQVVDQEQNLGQSGGIFWMRDQVISGQGQMTHLSKALLSVGYSDRGRRRS